MSIKQRKSDHIRLAMSPKNQMELPTNNWENIRLQYKALPELDLKNVNTSTILLNKEITQPLIIASMTGGSLKSQIINTNLGIAAQHCKIAVGVGSMRIALDNIDAEKSFKIIRQKAPDAVIFANMGAVQLNYGKTVDDYKKVIDMIEADGLYLHINPLQEAIQPEGDTNWSNLKYKIVQLIQSLSIPVFVKEVGHGLDVDTCNFLIENGVQGIDIAGIGGTSWAGIEADRANNMNLDKWFHNFGWSNVEILEKLNKKKKDKVSIVASGGIRSPIEGLKSRILGADYYSAAYPFLEVALDSPEKLINLINEWQRGLQIAMFVTGREEW